MIDLDFESCSKVRIETPCFFSFQSGAMADVDMGEVSAVGAVEARAPRCGRAKQPYGPCGGQERV